MNAQQLGKLGLTNAKPLARGGDKVIHAASSALCTRLVKCHLHAPFWHCAPMDMVQERAARLRKARADAGYEGPGDASRALGTARATYTQHENGTRGIPYGKAVRYAKKFKVSLEWLLTGNGTPVGRPKVNIICYIGAGAEIFPIDDHAQGNGLDEVEPPQGITNCVAAIIRGDSMHPLKDGWLVFWRRDQEGVPEECIGKLCAVQVKDGPSLLKEVQKGSKKGHFNLLSWNAPPRENVRLEWAARVLDIRPR